MKSGRRNQKKEGILHNAHTDEYIVRWPQGCLIILYALLGTIGCVHSSANNTLVMTAQDSLQESRRLQNASQQIKNAEPQIQNGDIITRTGNDFTSQSLKSLNQREQTYSHCGIASIEHDSIFIYHALGGEWNPDEKLRRDAFEIFTEPWSNNGFGIFRFDSTAIDPLKLVSTAQQWHAAGLMFDMKFDLQSDDRMYCAEFVAKSLKEASARKVQVPVSKIGDFLFIGVDDIFLHPACKRILQVLYN